MSAATQPAALPRTPSRRQQPPTYANTPDCDRPRRSMSTTQGPAASYNRTPSNNLVNAVRNDAEQSHVARPPSARRSQSEDRPMNGANPTRTESTRQAPSHSRTHSRYADQPTPAHNGNSDRTSTQAGSSSQPTMRRRTTIDATTGHWDLGKTIGAGSMGKVKLARNKETGEQVAVKIVPRQTTDGEHHTQADRDRADRSKEIRTAREAAIVTLVDHPYICGMRDVVRTNYHWYMLFEYVNGGQMLDYIISHGRLKEKQARKFGRQIASALDYCHRNSIVHRDLKIENILISKNGDIKIIDFGLSNLFSPRSHLKTFCGSLYFAAPELLQAKAYTGPEVDVWSFGIVLYVLVCGKVPFDDQSMPQLHAKIKRGNVEYPPWLTLECKGLIARMLNTNPQERATLQEIMNHPWMTKGFSGPPDNYLPARKPLQLPLDPAVVEKMTGFDFGEKEVITQQLTRVIESEEYQRAVRMSERRQATQTADADQKRGVFSFYKRRNSITSRDTLNTPSTEAVQLGNDPINAFHPLISVYYLAMEKQEREAREKNPGGLSMPGTPGEKPLAMPDLSPPAPAVTNFQAYEMPGEKPTGGRTRPRARTHGEDEVQEGMQRMDINSAPSPTNPAIVEPGYYEQQAAPPQRKESTAAGLLRRLSTRRSREPATERVPRGERPSHPPPTLAVFSPNAETPRKSFSVRRNRDRDATPTGYRNQAEGNGKEGMLSPPATGTGDGTNEKTFRRQFGLGRSISVNSSDVRRRLTRRGVSEGGSIRPPMISSSSHDGRKQLLDQSAARERDAASDVEGSRPTDSGFANRTKSLGHARRASMQGRRAARRGDATRTSDVPEETERDIMADEEQDQGQSARADSGFKPVYLKGMFSVSTTSSKPLPLIRDDIIRVLRMMGVEYTEVRGGFRCRHIPSIRQGSPPLSDEQPLVSPPPESGGHRRKISFGGFGASRNSERDAFRHAHPPQPPNTPKNTSTSAYNNNSHSHNNNNNNNNNNDATDVEDSDPSLPTHVQNPRQRAAGETSTHVQSDLGEGKGVKFEIFVVKVPLIGLHGIQFKKIDGGTWQYKEMASRILEELRL